MKYSLRIHKGISLLGFILLISVLFYLTYNTFKLKDEQYQTAEEALISQRYTQSIRNDKIFPGGVAIIDRYLMENIHALEAAYVQDKDSFENYKNRLLDSMFNALRLANTMDSLFAQIKAEHELRDNLQYLLTVNTIQLVFKDLHVVSIFQANQSGEFLPDRLTTPYGAYIGGTLEKPLPQNQITNLTVSTQADYNYWIGFSLYADYDNRTWNIFKLMMPSFLLALFAIGCVVSIYYITYRNWLRQKKLAEMKSDFVNSITHEFNTPLSTIIVANKNMQNDKILADANNIKPLTKIIERQSLRLQKLFDQVIDITTMDNSSLQKESGDIHLLLREIITDYNLKISGQHIDIQLNAQNQPFIIELNKFFFTTMIFNLFDNAIKYNDHVQKRIVVDIETTDAAINLRITDNGVGMPNKEIEHVFEKFYRIQKQGNQHISGLGLGLYYTYQCIKSHGWTLSVTSEEMVGSQFTIYIPYKT
ncbi:sensor histidine kinase [Parapedobacter tibetensis]|uniref:sensor histidine kinase n=1 Tax=Parapedobacter tibetensis TaxID=2972951 RepID=UPI00214D91FF|nr:HAMP domain-containing sensor histidine kinase [Parapedobacter tibetensis]